MRKPECEEFVVLAFLASAILFIVVPIGLVVLRAAIYGLPPKAPIQVHYTAEKDK
jgi:hypothetical protein